MTQFVYDGNGQRVKKSGPNGKTITQRAKEQELLWRGRQIRKGIESYYKIGHAGMQASLPQSMDDLIRDSL